jgi:hypothetical protein
MQIWSDAYKQQNVLNYKAHIIPLVSAFSLYYYPRSDGAKRRARVLIPPGYLHPGKRKH